MTEPVFSIITPTHRLDWLSRAFESVLSQTFTHWEWVILANGSLTVDEVKTHLATTDARVRVETRPNLPVNVGALKRQACELARGEYLVELDHDDILLPRALAVLEREFTGPPAPAMVYSDCVRFLPNNGGCETFAGWSVRDVGGGLTAPQTPPLLPQNVTRVWFSPDHVRAWRKSAYVAVGGHDRDLWLCDDVDLTARLFIAGTGPVLKAPEVLYHYHKHEANSSVVHNASVQELAKVVYRRWIEQAVLVDAGRRSLPCYDLGGALNPNPNWPCVDIKPIAGGLKADLSQKWPFHDSSVAAFRAQDFVEHVADPLHVMTEAHRCLVPGGLFMIEVPSTDGRGAWQDPTHRSFWNQNSFAYYCEPVQARYAGLDKPLFQPLLIEDHYPNEWCRQRRILYTRAHLAALKPGYHPYATYGSPWGWATP